MSSEVYEIVDVGIDYLTSTFSGRKSSREAAIKAFDLLENEMQSGNIRKPWAMAGYSGWASGAVQVGHNHDRVLVRLSSHAAHDNWRWFGERADNISRIDYQVTSRTNDTPTRRLAKHWRQARKFKREHKTNASVGAYFGDDSTPTIYLGRRISNRFGRIYDKERESNDDRWKGCVRYEVEYKNDSGTLMTNSLLRSSGPTNQMGCDVLDFFRNRGVPIKGFLNGMGNYSSIRNTSDASRRIKWIQSQVAPAARALVEFGMAGELLDALGLKVSPHGVLALSGPTVLMDRKKEVA